MNFYKRLAFKCFFIYSLVFKHQQTWHRQESCLTISDYLRYCYLLWPKLLEFEKGRQAIGFLAKHGMSERKSVFFSLLPTCPLLVSVTCDEMFVV